MKSRKVSFEVLLLLLFAAALRADVMYTVTEMTGMGGAWISPRGIDNTGQIVGWCVTGTSTPAFIWKAGAPVLFPAGGGQSIATNSKGQVVMGSSIWENGTVRSIGITGCAINSNGEVAGGTSLWRDGTVTSIGITARGLNDLGEVVGTSGSHAASWNNGVTTDLGLLPGYTSSAAYAVNNSGMAVGMSDRYGSFKRACLWQDGVLTDLGTLGGSSSLAAAVNSRGEIVGWSHTTGRTHGFIWKDGEMKDLNSLIDPSLGWVIDYAGAINDQGWIAAGGYSSRDGSNHGFLLVPVPEPGSLAMLGLGMLMLARNR